MSLNAAEVNLKSSFYLAFDRLVTGQWSRVVRKDSMQGNDSKGGRPERVVMIFGKLCPD